MRSCLAVLATGLGKTIEMAALCDAWPVGRVLALVHREELAFQFQQKVESYMSGPVDLEMADWQADQCAIYHRSKVICASVPTLNSRVAGQRRMERFDPAEFGLILTDEAHHAIAATYRRIYDYFGAGNPDICHVGFTATADRGDKIPLGMVYNRVAADRQIDWGVKHGWLVPLKQKIAHLDTLNLSQIRTRLGDLAENELEAVMLAEGNLHGVATHTLNTIGDRPAIVYCTGVKQAHAMADLFCRYAKRKIAAAIDGRTEKPERRQTLADLKTGRLQIVCNCGVLTEGYDEPGVRLIVNARPTKKRSLYTQIVGRGTRPLPGTVDNPTGVWDEWTLRDYQAHDVARIMELLGHGAPHQIPLPDDNARAERIDAIAASGKPDCVVLDFTGVAGRHRLVTTLDLLGNTTDAGVLQRAKAKMTTEAMDPAEAVAAAEHEIADEVRQRARMRAWRDVMLPETHVHGPTDVPIVKPTRASPASPKQLALLRRFRVPEHKLKNLTRGGAGRLISQCLAFKRKKKP